MKNLVLLVLRLVTGSLMAAHGAQKLFGSFNGPGIKGTSGFMEKLGVKPGRFWGPVAAIGEFSGGTLTVLGLLSPFGPQNIMSAMSVAIRRAHWKTPLWAAEGGAELPMTNLAVALSLAILGPGKYSVDRLFGIRLPKWLVALSWLNFVVITAAALFRPEIVQTALDRVTGKPLSGEQPAPAKLRDKPQVEIEQRPRAPEPVRTKQTAEI